VSTNSLLPPLPCCRDQKFDMVCVGGNTLDKRSFVFDHLDPNTIDFTEQIGGPPAVFFGEREEFFLEFNMTWDRPCRCICCVLLLLMLPMCLLLLGLPVP
jgi:hypothetical protein